MKVTAKQARALGLEVPKARKLSPAEKLAAKAKRDALEDWFAADFRRRFPELPKPFREWKFHPARKWALDFAWPELQFGVEVDGGTFSSGRHVRGEGFAEDAHKLNEAALAGWTLLRFDSRMVRSGEAADVAARAICAIRERKRQP